MKDKITLNDAAFTRLTFRRKDGAPTNHRWVYDIRGYEFVHRPITGGKGDEPEPKDSRLSSCDVGILFDFYNDGWDEYFAFYTGDCFDPPMKLICARTWEEAYEIFLDEYADIPDDSDVEDVWHDCLVELVEKEIKAGSINDWDRTQKSVDDWLSDLAENNTAEWDKLRDKALEHITDNGMFSWAPNGERVGAPPCKFPYLRCSESIQGFELELVKAEVLP